MQDLAYQNRWVTHGWRSRDSGVVVLRNPAHQERGQLGQPDSMTPLGTKGVGELSITGLAAAIANAVYHATGTRVRSLPISIEKVLAR
jgi:CO/xanthine dehydrogenase Mo-binding subunit